MGRKKTIDVVKTYRHEKARREAAKAGETNEATRAEFAGPASILAYDRDSDETRRYDISSAIDLGIGDREACRVEYGTGVWLRRVLLMPRSKRVLVRTFSQWVQRDGTQTGHRWHVADAEEIAHLARKFQREELKEILPVVRDEEEGSEDEVEGGYVEVEDRADQMKMTKTSEKGKVAS